jgi:hypothetical protein
MTDGRDGELKASFKRDSVCDGVFGGLSYGFQKVKCEGASTNQSETTEIL